MARLLEYVFVRPVRRRLSLFHNGLLAVLVWLLLAVRVPLIALAKERPLLPFALAVKV